MKKTLKITALILVAALVAVAVYAYLFLSSIAPIATGYAAKILCSSVYVSDLTYESVMNEDLEMADDYMIKARLDRKSRAAEATLLGLFKSRSVYRECLGCTLVNEIEEEALRKQAIDLKPNAFDTSKIPWPSGDLLSGPSSLFMTATSWPKGMQKASQAICPFWDGP